MKKVFFLILIIATSGCGSQKSSVKENVKLDTAENVDKTEKQMESTGQSDVTVIEINSDVADKSVIIETITDYSRPDDAGTQYKTREKRVETRKDIDSKSGQYKRTISEQKSEIERLTVDNSKLKTKLDMALREKSKTTTRVPLWLYVATFLFGAGSALIIKKWVKTRFSL